MKQDTHLCLSIESSKCDALLWSVFTWTGCFLQTRPFCRLQCVPLSLDWIRWRKWATQTNLNWRECFYFTWSDSLTQSSQLSTDGWLRGGEDAQIDKSFSQHKQEIQLNDYKISQAQHTAASLFSSKFETSRLTLTPPFINPPHIVCSDSKTTIIRWNLTHIVMQNVVKCI